MSSFQNPTDPDISSTQPTNPFLEDTHPTSVSSFQNANKETNVSTCDDLSAKDKQELKDLRYHNKVLKQQLSRMKRKNSECLSKMRELEEKVKNLDALKITKIIEDANNADEKSIFLLDLIKNHYKKIPRWSEMSLRLCTVWRFCSPKGYRFCHNNLLKLPSKSTISRFLGDFHGQNKLIQERLCAEIGQLKKPVERICSLIMDDMSIKEKVHYCRAEDRIYGLETTSSTRVGTKPKVANKMLCFVVQGLSTRYTIPAGYFFHSSLTTQELYLLTKNILQLLTNCGYIVIRFVTDNISTNVALFKKFGNGSLKNSINHPILEHIPLFLSFDFCHALKNARNLFLDHDMYSSQGKISSCYLKLLYDLQKGMPVKPVRYLTKKHLFPSNFEKMNVLRAIQVFSPTVTSSLKFLKAAGDDRFVDADASIFYMENMYHFFQVHNVSSRDHYLRSLDSSIAPYVHISDERLDWLNVTFPKYIDDIQKTSVDVGFKGLTKETAHALQFTAKSTYLCVNFLLSQVGFYYVVTRSFSSDAVEAMFSHVRLKGGSNDATDARAADYALRQILRCGIVKASHSSNTAENVNYISPANILNLQENRESFTKHTEQLIFPIEVRRNIHNLKKCIIPDNNIFSASVAFLAGYIIKKLEDLFHCDECLTPLLCTSIPGPLLQLIAIQNRGGLVYPKDIFVGIIQLIAESIQQMLPFLQHDNPGKYILEELYPHLVQNPIFVCANHRDSVCKYIIKTTVKPVLSNLCLETTDSVKRFALNFKPKSRKVLKL